MLSRPSPTDRYIRKATQGLPHRERVDTAAELRVHLKSKIQDLMAAGFSQEEAEHLAVQEMGDPVPTNRQLLGQSFSRRAGWWTLGLLLAGLGWLAFDRNQRPVSGVEHLFQLGPTELHVLAQSGQQSTTGWHALKVTYPAGTKRVVYGVLTGQDTQPRWLDAHWQKKQTPPLQTRFLLGTVKSPEPETCGPLLPMALFSEIHDGGWSRSWVTQCPVPAGPAVVPHAPHWSHHPLWEEEIPMNQWVPLADVLLINPCPPGPSCHVQGPDRSLNLQRPESWGVLAVKALPTTKGTVGKARVSWDPQQNRWRFTDRVSE